MSDPCRWWRRQLSRHADGALSPVQWGALQDHLAQCAACRAARGADGALRDVLSAHAGLPDEDRSARFDDRVVRLVQTALPARRPLWQRVLPSSLFVGAASAPPRMRRNTSRFGPLNFASQVAGGALAAVLLTAVCLLPTLRPPHGRGVHSHATRQEPNEPPVPLEALLETNAPRAALLWRASGRAYPSRFPIGQPNTMPRPDTKKEPTPSGETKPDSGSRHPDQRQHGSLPSRHVLG